MNTAGDPVSVAATDMLVEAMDGVDSAVEAALLTLVLLLAIAMVEVAVPLTIVVCTALGAATAEVVGVDVAPGVTVAAILMPTD